ncbi:MAG: hypothetical protein ACRD2W_15810 [Acidimicrobiales bacterium]
MRRAIAVVAAVAMIAAAAVIRSRLDDDEVARTVRLVCATELEAACTHLTGRLQTTVEPAGTTAGRLATASGDPGLDGWLVPDPYPEIVDQRRQRASLPPSFGSQQTLARSPLVLVVWNERSMALGRQRCPQQVDWRCLGDAVAAGPWTASSGQAAWDRIKPGHRPASTDATGMLVLGHAVSGWFGTASLSTADLDDDSFARWFTAVERAVPSPSPPEGPLQRMLTVGPAAYDAVGTTEAEAGPLLAASPRRGELNLLYPSPMATADVVLAVAVKGSTASAVRRLAGGNDARQSLAGIGWRVQGVARAPGIPDSPPLPPASGLPSAGLLQALQDLVA